MGDFNANENRASKESNRSHSEGNGNFGSSSFNVPSESSSAREGMTDWTSRREADPTLSNDGSKSMSNKRSKPHKHSIPLVTPQNTILKPQPLYESNGTTSGDKDDSKGVSQSGLCGQQATNGGRGYSFPDQLYQMINTEDDSVMEWAESGKAFYIRAKITEKITKYFRQTKLESFQRQLNLYGFTLLTKGEDRGAYFHPLFLRDEPELCQYIKRTPGRGARATARDLTQGSVRDYSNNNGTKNGKRSKDGKDYDPSEENNGEITVDQRGTKRKSGAMLSVHTTPNTMFYQENAGYPLNSDRPNPQYPHYGSPHRPNSHYFNQPNGPKSTVVVPNGNVFGMNGRPQQNSQQHQQFNFPQNPNSQIPYQQPFPSAPPHPIPSPPPTPQYQYQIQSSISPSNTIHDGQMMNTSTTPTPMMDYSVGQNTNSEMNSMTNLRNNVPLPGSVTPSKQMPSSSSQISPGTQISGLSYSQQGNPYTTPRGNRAVSQIFPESFQTRMSQDNNNNNNMPRNPQILPPQSPGRSMSPGNNTGGNNPGINYISHPHSQSQASQAQSSLIQPPHQNQQPPQQQQNTNNISAAVYSQSKTSSFNYPHPSTTSSNSNQYNGNVNHPSFSNLQAPSLNSSASNNSAYSLNSNPMSNPNENHYLNTEMQIDSFNNERERQRLRQRSSSSPLKFQEGDSHLQNKTQNERDRIEVMDQKWMVSSPNSHGKTEILGKNSMFGNGRHGHLMSQSLSNGTTTPTSRSSGGEAYTTAISPTSSIGPSEYQSEPMSSISTQRSNGKEDTYPYAFEGRQNSAFNSPYGNEDTDNGALRRPISPESKKPDETRNGIQERNGDLSLKAKRVLERLSEKQIKRTNGKSLQQSIMLAKKDQISNGKELDQENSYTPFQPPVFLTEKDLICREGSISDPYVFPPSDMTVVDSREKMNKFLTEANMNLFMNSENFIESKTNNRMMEVSENERLFDLEGSLLDTVYKLTQQGEHVTLVSCFDSLDEVCFQDLFLRTGVTSDLIRTVENYVDVASTEMKEASNSSFLSNDGNRHPPLNECRKMVNDVLIETTEGKESEEREGLDGTSKSKYIQNNEGERGAGNDHNSGIFYFPSTSLVRHNETSKYKKYDLPAMMNLILIPMYESSTSHRTEELETLDRDTQNLYFDAKNKEQMHIMKNSIALSAGLNRNIKNLANRSTTLIIYMNKSKRDRVVHLLESPFLHNNFVKQKDKETDKEEGSGTEMKRPQTQTNPKQVPMKSYFRKTILFCK